MQIRIAKTRKRNNWTVKEKPTAPFAVVKNIPAIR
jgi:hypothetical protein